MTLTVLDEEADEAVAVAIVVEEARAAPILTDLSALALLAPAPLAKAVDEDADLRAFLKFMLDLAQEETCN